MTACPYLYDRKRDVSTTAFGLNPARRGQTFYDRTQPLAVSEIAFAELQTQMPAMASQASGIFQPMRVVHTLYADRCFKPALEKVQTDVGAKWPDCNLSLQKAKQWKAGENLQPADRLPNSATLV